MAANQEFELHKSLRIIFIKRGEDRPNMLKVFSFAYIKAQPASQLRTDTWEQLGYICSISSTFQENKSANPAEPLSLAYTIPESQNHWHNSEISGIKYKI